VQRWLVHLLTRYSDAYASNQFRALQQFFRWLADEEDLPDPMAGLRAPKVTEKLVPVFTSEELSALQRTCQGRSFGQRRDTAIIDAVLIATGIRAGDLAGIRYDPHDPRRSDVDLWAREITVRGKGGKPRVVRIGHEAARALDRYLRVRSRHGQAWRRKLESGELPLKLFPPAPISLRMQRCTNCSPARSPCRAVPSSEAVARREERARDATDRASVCP
jgi:integrase/recombinase XerD